MSDKRKSLHNALIQPKIQSVQIRSIRVISVQKKAKTPFHSLTLCERYKKSPRRNTLNSLAERQGFAPSSARVEQGGTTLQGENPV